MEKTAYNDMLLTLEQQLQTVFDPEFPVIDIYTLGLIYDIQIFSDQERVHIVMTFTTPACPMGDMIEQMTKNCIHDVYPAWLVTIEITFEPMRTPKMIKDEDLQRMFD